MKNPQIVELKAASATLILPQFSDQFGRLSPPTAVQNGSPGKAHRHSLV
jgi:hypothetical protein